MAADTRDRILDALEAKLLRGGAASITLEAVAEEAKVSKGGLLYHFPGKEALLLGAADRLEERVRAQLRRVVDRGDSVSAWYLSTAQEAGQSEEDLAVDRSVTAIMRALDGQFPELQRRMRRIMRTFDEHILAELGDPVLAEIVRLAGDGLYLAEIFGLEPPEAALTRRMRARLLGEAGASRAAGR